MGYRPALVADFKSLCQVAVEFTEVITMVGSSQRLFLELYEEVTA